MSEQAPQTLNLYCFRNSAFLSHSFGACFDFAPLWCHLKPRAGAQTALASEKKEDYIKRSSKKSMNAPCRNQEQHIIKRNFKKAFRRLRKFWGNLNLVYRKNQYKKFVSLYKKQSLHAKALFLTVILYNN
ncbi:MAG: hypothetical protein HDT46_03760 [Ruminococcaceae bacterium]|nr:hypothetical protein [Oscillospiraceae bacterium]